MKPALGGALVREVGRGGLAHPFRGWRFSGASLLVVLAAAVPPARAADLPHLGWSGRVQLDYSGFQGVYSQEGRSHGARYLRRAEAEAQLRWRSGWSVTAALEADSQSQLTWSSLFLAWQPGGGLELRAGRVDPDVGLEPSTSSNWTWGIERSAVFDLAPDVASANEGLALRADAHGKAYHVSLGVYDKRDHHALAARGVWVSVAGPAGVLQLGVSGSRSGGWQGDGRVRSRLAVRGVTEADAGRRISLASALQAPTRYDQDAVWAAEAAWQRGRLSLQAEALTRRLSGPGVGRRVAQGAYVLAAWVLHGGNRRHDAARARFGRPQAAGTPASAAGQWEVFARVDALQVRGARSARVHTAGLSWTAPAYWRLALNVHQASADDGNAVGDKKGTAWAMRLQAVF